MAMSRAEPGAHVFTDESKSKAYLMAATAVPKSDLAEARKHVRNLRHRGSQSIHMRKESDRSKRIVVDGLLDFGFQVTMVLGRYSGPELGRRKDCLATIVRGCAADQAERLVIERDDSLVKHDQELLFEEVHSLGGGPDYTWLSRNEEPLLWVSDAVAWCYAQGGSWRGRVRPLIRAEMSAVHR